MLEIKFKYRDRLSYPRWNEQCCCVSSVEECKRIYGLGVDCEYEILSVETEEDAQLRRRVGATMDFILNALYAPVLNEEATAKLNEELSKVLKEAEVKKTYRAFEGDFRIITEDKNGNEYRYILGKDGSLTEKP